MILSPKETRALYEHAVTHRYAILAVNADSPAAITDCLLAAKKCDAPIIIETSLWQLTGHSFGAGDPLTGIDRYLAGIAAIANSQSFAEVPVVYHTDHIKGPETLTILEHAMKKAASSISLDSSDLSHQKNIAHLNSLCQFAAEHALDATLEMEAGVDDGVTPLEETTTLFGAVESAHPGYLALWAPGVGTQHGLEKDLGGFSTSAISDHQKAASDLAGRAIGIALHGSSGLSETQLGEAVSAGVAKVNWSSESLLLRSTAAREFYSSHAKQLQKSHPDFKATAMDQGVQSFVSRAYLPKVKSRIRSLNGDGLASAFLKSQPAS